MNKKISHKKDPFLGKRIMKSKKGAAIYAYVSSLKKVEE